MATLLLRFTEGVYLPDHPLHPVDAFCARVPHSSVIHNTRRIHYGKDAVVYKGEVLRKGQPAEEVVLKFVVTPLRDACIALEKECNFYCNQLNDL